MFCPLEESWKVIGDGKYCPGMLRCSVKYVFLLRQRLRKSTIRESKSSQPLVVDQLQHQNAYSTAHDNAWVSDPPMSITSCPENLRWTASAVLTSEGWKEIHSMRVLYSQVHGRWSLGNMNTCTLSLCNGKFSPYKNHRNMILPLARLAPKMFAALVHQHEAWKPARDSAGDGLAFE